MPKGGTRPGAGLKKGYKFKSTLTKEAAREALAALVKEHLTAMTAAQIANAKGIKYLVVRDKKTGKFLRVGEALARSSNEETIEVWEKDPSSYAYADLMDRALDKAANSVAVTHSGNIRIEIAVPWLTSKP